MAEDRAGAVDLNTAGVEELIRLPGIGPVLAQRIVAARPFESVDDLVRVRGIGADTLERLRPGLALSAGGGFSSAAGVEYALEEGQPAAPEPSDLGSDVFPLREEDTEPEAAAPATEAETVSVEAKAPETVLLPVPELGEAEEVFEMEEGEAPTDAFETEASEAEVAEAEALEAEVLEAEVAEADVSEMYVLEAEASEAEVGEAYVPEVEGAEMAASEVEDVEEGASAWETESIPGFGDEEPPVEMAPEPQRPVVTRAGVRRGVLFSILLATLLATLLSLGIVSFINGGRLQFVTPAQFGELSARAEGLEAQAGALAQDIESLRKRLDNLEALSGRLSAVEQATEQVQADLEAAGGEVERLAKSVGDLEAQAADLEAQAADLAQQAEEVEARVGTLEAQGSRVQAFLEGLAELMSTLFPPEESTP